MAKLPQPKFLTADYADFADYFEAESSKKNKNLDLSVPAPGLRHSASAPRGLLAVNRSSADYIVWPP